jgi:hypothetical protein
MPQHIFFHLPGFKNFIFEIMPLAYFDGCRTSVLSREAGYLMTMNVKGRKSKEFIAAQGPV